jgi:hypothetical protein
MANETELSNLALQTDVLSVEISEAFVEKGIGLALVHSEGTNPGVTTKEFRKDGSLTAQTVSEGGNFTYGAGAEVTQASVTATLEKKVAAAKPTVETIDIGTLSEGQLAGYAGNALARLFDTDLTTLFASITNTVTATNIMTVDELFDARYTVESAMKGAHSGFLVGMFDYKALNELRKELKDTAGAAFVSQVNLGGILGGVSGAKKYSGNIAGIDLYAVSGLQTDSGDDVAGVWDPMFGFAAAVRNNGAIPEHVFTGSQGMHREHTYRMYWKVVAWNDTAAVAVKSDT